MAPPTVESVLAQLQDISSCLNRMKIDRRTEDDEMAAKLRAERRMIGEEKIERTLELSSEHRIQRMEAAVVGWQQHQSLRTLQQIIADENSELKALDNKIATKYAGAIHRHQALVSDLKLMREEEDLQLRKEIGALLAENAGSLSKLTNVQFQALDGDIQAFFMNEVAPVALAWNGLLTPHDTPPTFNGNQVVGSSRVIQVPPTPTPSSRKARAQLPVRSLKSTPNRSRLALGMTGQKDIYDGPDSDDDEQIKPLAKRRKTNNSPDITIEEELAVNSIVAVAPQSPATVNSDTISAPSSPLQLLEISSREATPEYDDVQISYDSASDYEETENKKRRSKGRAPINTDIVEIQHVGKKDRLHLGDLIAKPSVDIPASRKSISYSVWSRRLYVPEKLLKFMVNIVHVRKEGGEASVWNDTQSELTFFLARQDDIFVPVIGHIDKSKIHPEFVFDSNEFHSIQYNSYSGLVCLTKIYRVNPDVMIVFDSRQDLWNFLSVVKVEFADRKILLEENVELIFPKSWLI